MKIGFVLDDTLDSTNGVQQYVKTLGRWMIKEGHEVRFLVGESYDKSEFGERVVSLAKKNIDVRWNQQAFTFPLLPDVMKMREVIRDENFDILHVQVPYNPSLSQLLMALTNVPKVGTFHTIPANLLTTLGANFLSVIQRGSLDGFSKIMTVSNAAQAFAKDHFGVDSSVVPNTVDVNSFRRGKVIEKYRKQDTVNIFFLGNLVERKGIMELLKAYKQLQQICDQDYQLLIAGKGYLEKSVKKYIKQNNLKNVTLLGYIADEEKADYFATADICVFPSLHGESFGIVLIEAMAAGKAIIAGNNVGYKTVLKNKGSLLLVEPEDSLLFAEKLKVLVENEHLRKEFGEWGQTEVYKYDVETVGPKIIEIYNKAILHKKTNNSIPIIGPMISLLMYLSNVVIGSYKAFSRFFQRRINKDKG